MPKSDLVLLAINEGQNLKLFEQALAVASYKVAVARDRDALDKALQESSPALVIIAQLFNTADGLETAAGLLDRFPTLPIIIFLSRDSPALFRRALQIGISDCLSAPLRVEDVIHAVENSLRRSRHLGDWTRREVKRTTATLQQRLDDLQKLETIIDQIDEGVLILDDKLRILLLNPAARRAFGIWHEDEVIGRPMREVLSHPDLHTLLQTDPNNPLTHSEIAFEDGRVLSSQLTSIPGIGIAITMRDITYLRQIERLKTEFVHTVSHDLRSPLTAILGYVELLERVGPINDAQREFIQRVHLSVQSITSLVNDLLDLGRIEAGFDSQKEMVSIDVVLRNALSTLDQQILNRRQKIQLDLPSGEIPAIRGNPIRLRQMLDNLIGNAIKYTPEEGSITVKIEVRSEQVILQVLDTGPGIPPADQPHIFDKFYRASNVPKGVGGSGLGLAIVKSIVDDHQGRIWVESVLGQGTTFTIVLPVYKKETAKPKD